MELFDAISPNWVQVGELGLAFVVIILCAWLVHYTMKTSAERERLLMQLIDNQQGKLTELSTAIQNMANSLEAIEAKVKIRATRSPRKGA